MKILRPSALRAFFRTTRRRVQLVVVGLRARRRGEPRREPSRGRRRDGRRPELHEPPDHRHPPRRRRGRAPGQVPELPWQPDERPRALLARDLRRHERDRHAARLHGAARLAGDGPGDPAGRQPAHAVRRRAAAHVERVLDAERLAAIVRASRERRRRGRHGRLVGRWRRGQRPHLGPVQQPRHRGDPRGRHRVDLRRRERGAGPHVGGRPQRRRAPAQRPDPHLGDRHGSRHRARLPRRRRQGRVPGQPRDPRRRRDARDRLAVRRQRR